MKIGKIKFGNYDLLASIGIAVLGFNLVACNNSRLDEGIAAGPPPTISTPSADPIESQFPDCGDGNPPCVTWDNGEWRLVHNYKPYHMTSLVVCGAEDGGPVLPCVGRDQHKNGKWLVFTKEAIS